MKRIPNSKMTKVFLGVGVTLLLMRTFVGHAKAVALKRGDILVADASAVGGAGAVIRVDPLTGTQTPVSLGGNFLGPAGITLDPAGQILVADVDAFGGSGGRWFTPDPQTCVCTPGSKATFGLVTKYQKGATVPTGNQEFQYKVDNINLHSTSFDWLVVSGAQAQFQGTGTINGAGAFKFRVTVRDGDQIGQPDRFEIRILPAGSTDFGGPHIWKGGNDLTDPNGAGSIVIHD